jgi:flagellar hook-associated protein 2
MDFLLSPILSTSWTASASGNDAGPLNRTLKIHFSSSQDVPGQLEALNGLYARAYRMLSFAHQLSGAAGRANFSQPPTRSSDVDVVNIVYFDKTHYLSRTAEDRFIFLVQQIARNQVNQGVALYPGDGSVIGTGSNTFLLDVGGTGYTLSVTVNPGDTNATALAKIALAIAAANTGVSTALVPAGDTIRLDLYGRTGEENAFSLSDLSGNAVSASGINTSTQSAADAKFLLNGTTYIQPGNEVSLQDGHLKVNLTGPGTATVITGPQAVVDLVQSLTTAMSSFGSYLARNRYLNPGISPAWSKMVGQEAGILSRYGLEGGLQGQVGLDTLKFTSALEQNTAQAAAAVGTLAARVRDFVWNLTSYPAAALLASSVGSGYGSAYGRSAASASWRQAVANSFWAIA